MSVTGPAEWPAEFERLIRAHCRFVDETVAIGPDEPLTLLGLDSVQLITMIVELEETFLVEVPDTMLTGEHFSTPGSVWAAIRSLLPAGTTVGGGEDR